LQLSKHIKEKKIEVNVLVLMWYFFFLFCCRLLSCLMLLARTELHSQDMINEKLHKAEEIGMESFPCPLEAYTVYIQIFI